MLPRLILYFIVSSDMIEPGNVHLLNSLTVHHANLDRLWWSWQAQNLSVRFREISGPIYLMDYDNLQGGNVTLEFTLSVGQSAPNVTVGDVMDITSGAGDGIMCYIYDHLYTY